METTTSSLVIYTDIISTDYADELLAQCKELPLDVEPAFKLYGKQCRMHRCIGFFSDESSGYRYSGQTSTSQPLPPFMKDLLQLINSKFDASYNGILVNLYRHGSDYISKHSDDEKYFDANAGVVALSLGSSRVFRVRDKLTGNIVKDITTDHGQVMAMRRDFQKEFTHEIPAKKGAGLRISLTFRAHRQ
jgi:alkylated DNA repair dioxygenase AlkB